MSELVYLLEVMKERRSGRGRYWRANSAGYTDRLEDAGLYPASHDRVANREDVANYNPIEAIPVFLAEADRLEKAGRTLRARITASKILHGAQ